MWCSRLAGLQMSLEQTQHLCERIQRQYAQQKKRRVGSAPSITSPDRQLLGELLPTIQRNSVALELRTDCIAHLGSQSADHQRTAPTHKVGWHRDLVPRQRNEHLAERGSTSFFCTVDHLNFCLPAQIRVVRPFPSGCALGAGLSRIDATSGWQNKEHA